MALFDCTIEATCGHARALSYETAHGTFHTPMFMPVGTSATVKGITVDQLHQLNSQVVLANTYHLSMRPGADLVEEAGGVHKFMNYDGPMLTDSGGFQVFSLADTLKLDADGLTFRSIYDGSYVRWTPESNMRIQEQIGADIAMQLDQCTPYPAERSFVANAVDLSANWARRCLAAHKRPDQTLFGIVQDVFLTKHYRKIYDAEDVVRREKAAQRAAEEAEKERIRAARRAANPEGITENTSKKKQQLRERQGREAAAKDFEAKKRAAAGLAPEEAAEVLSGDPERPFSRGRAYSSEHYTKNEENE